MYSIYHTILFISICFGVSSCHPVDADQITIQIEDGTIAGRYVETNSKFFAFQEIPFAAPPVGSLRFQEPQPPTKWEGILNTTKNTKICVNFLPFDDPMENEDCLYLNVYTPVDPRNNDGLLPVLFWIHGGGFIMGSGIYDLYGPDFFMNYSIILVTVNYRMGPLGFLTTGDNVIPGNLGLKDQNFALQWIQKNIKSFGGNPEQVTIMGQSAGAASVAYHLLSDKSKGLFRAAIMESGTALSCWSLFKYGREASYIFGESLSTDFNSKNSSEDLLKLLQSVSVPELKNKSFTPMPSEYGTCYGSGLAWVPVIENDDYSHAFVKGLSHDKFKNGNFNQVPLLAGFASMEMLSLGLDSITPQSKLFDSNASYIVNANLRMKADNKFQAGTEIKQIYTNETFTDDLPTGVKFFSDCQFTTPVSRTAHLYSQYQDVYLYQFSYIGQMGKSFINVVTVKGAEGAGHSEELGYLFQNSVNEDLSQFPESDLTTKSRLLAIWTEFVKTNKPIADGTWPRVNSEDLYYMDIDTELTVKEGPKKYKEWSNVISKYADSVLDTY